MSIYIRVGKVVFDWRSSVLSMERAHSISEQFPSTGIMKTSEVIVTRTEENRNVSRPFSHLNKKSSFPNTTIAARQTVSRVYRPSGATNPNKAAIKYCKCALLFFIALIITWVPSTVNRIFNIVRPNDVIFGLNLAAALVLPLQGFWNAVIYIATSTFAVNCLWQDIQHACGFNKPKHDSVGMGVRGGLTPTQKASALNHGANSLRNQLKSPSSQSDLVGPAK